MSTVDKLIERIETRPIRKDITFSDLSKYLNNFGFFEDRCQGSHHQFLHSSGLLITIVEKNGVIKASYIRDAIRQVELVK